MTEKQAFEVQRVAAAFAAEPGDGDDEIRIVRMMQRIRSEVASREVLLFVFVRIWLTAVEFGAGMCARSGRNKRT